MKITRLEKYTPEMADQVRKLLIQLSRSGKDRGEIPKEWFEDIINSNFHDLLLAIDDDGKIIGVASLTVVMGPSIRKNAYLEDFVTDANVRGQGVGSAMWEEMLKWAKEKGCQKFEFTSGHGREVAQNFYKSKGVEIYDTNFFRKEL